MIPGYGMDGAGIMVFLLVFVRCSALLLASPVFGAQTTPIQIRIMTTLSISAALVAVVRPDMGPPPQDVYSLVAAVAQEAAIGLLIGTFMTLALQVAQIAGGLMDLQVGLSSSQIMNPVNGVPSTILAQYKYLLGVVTFLAMDGHQLIIRSLAQSYHVAPTFSMSNLNGLRDGIVGMVSQVCLLAIQIAAPVMGVSMVLDATLGLVSRAVPQFQAMMIGLPAKISMGLVAVGIGLPAVATGVASATGLAMKSLAPLFGGAH